MNVWEPASTPKRAVHRPRPGHADLAGGWKYGETDLRNILERASARETAARTAAGTLCRFLLEQADIQIASHVIRIGSVSTEKGDASWNEILAVQESDRLRCVDPQIEKKMMEAIDAAQKNKETLGGEFQVVVRNVPPGLGSHTHW